MVIKGNARGGAASLAAHLQRTDTNEVAELRELRGVAAEDLDGALREMEAVAAGARSARHFYHASINTRADEVMTPEQWKQAVDRLERELNLTGQPRAVVAHVKEGRAHVHIAWSRIDIGTLRAIPDSHNYRRHELVSRELEREFGHARVQGVHIERAGEPRPERTPSHAEMQQAERSGLAPAEARTLLTEIWNRTDSGQAFAAAIDEQGWMLARGDKRDFVVLDPAGETHNLARRIEGAKAKDVRAHMADIEVASLPSVDEAKEIQRARLQAQADARAGSVPQPLPAQSPKAAIEQGPKSKSKASARFDAFEAEQRHYAREAQMEEDKRGSGEPSQPTEDGIRDAQARYRTALASHYDDADPYGSLSRAAMAEYEAFKSERDQLTDRIANEPDERARNLLELRREIEGSEYMAITTQRLAVQKEVVSGGSDSSEAHHLHRQADNHLEQGKELRRRHREAETQKAALQTGGDLSEKEELGQGVAEVLEEIRRQREREQAEDHSEGLMKMR